MSVLEQLAATVIRSLATEAIGNDLLLEGAAAALESLRKFAMGEQSAEATRTELDALADHDQLGKDLSAIRAKSREDLKGR